MVLIKKGQTATEYLIILAVVIILALIVVGVMGGIPRIGGGASSRTSAASWAQASVGITAHSIDTATDIATLNIRNNQRNSVTVTSITFGGETVTVNGSSTVLNVGQTKTLKGPQTPGLTVAPCDTAGDAYAFGVTITYTDSATGAVYTETAGGTEITGSCSN